MVFNGFKDLVDACNAMLRDLPEKRKQESLILASDAKATIDSRITETGIDADGKALGDNEGSSPYSESVVPAYLYGLNKNITRDAKKVAANLQKRVGYFASYKDFRDELGLPTDKVTTNLTGQMWRSIAPEVVEHNNDVTVVEITASDEENKKKLEYLSNQYGDLLRLSQSEFTDLQNDNNARVEQCVKQYFG